MSENSQPKELNLIERGLIWLSTADSEVLREHCPKWERLKYAAFGASLLVPFLFGMIAASYAVSTLTENKIIIVGFAIIWGFIIITIDRVLLATYRAFIPFSRKMMQFFLRITVAVLMGLTVSHPLTLMLFKDTITSEIEKGRAEEMAAARSSTDAQKQDVNERIAAATQNLQGLQQRYQEVIAGGFLNAPAAPQGQTPQQQARDSQFADIDAQIREYKNERDQVQEALSRWQRVYDDEISGARTGKPGIGPNARAIERDELVWRRDQVRQLGKVIGDLTAKRTELSSRLLAESAAANAKIEASRREFEEQKLDMFKNQQGDLLAVIKGQIDSASAELTRLRTESEQITDNTIDRVDSLKEEKRADLMVQTIVLHHLFKKEGGGFALAVYIVIAGLFTLIDTIPLVVKFFSVPGIYDHHQECKEKLDREEKRVKSDNPEHYETERDKTINEIKEEVLLALRNKEVTADSLTEIVDLTRSKLDLVESIEKYQPKQLEISTADRKRLPYHDEWDDESDSQTSEAKTEKSRTKVVKEEVAREPEKQDRQQESVEDGKVVPFQEPATEPATSPGKDRENGDAKQEVRAVSPRIKVGDPDGKKPEITRSGFRKAGQEQSGDYQERKLEPSAVASQPKRIKKKSGSVLKREKTGNVIEELSPSDSSVEGPPAKEVEPVEPNNDFVEEPEDRGFGDGESAHIASQLKDILNPRNISEQTAKGGIGVKPMENS